MTTIASGMTMRLLPKTNYNFDKLQTSQTTTFAICQHIDVSVFQEVSFAIRFYGGTLGTGASIAFAVVADGYTLDDPTAFFATADATGTAFGSFSFSSTTPAPAFTVLTVTKPCGHLLNVTLTATQGSSLTSVNGTFGIDVTMKGGDPSSLPLDYSTYRGYRI